MAGIVSYGGYIPRLRLNRMAIFGAMGWFAPAIAQMAQGEKAMCNWDEDSLTMAVAASRDCLKGLDKSTIDAAYMASTTFPFADRQNSGVLKEALNIGDEVATADFSSAQKAGASALVSALNAVKSGNCKNVLVAAADKRETKSAYLHEMWYGDGAAALVIGDGDAMAEIKGVHSISRDFVPHYRGAGRKYDYNWEERWIRDEGYGKIIPEAITGVLEKGGVKIEDVSKFVYPCFFRREHGAIAKRLGIPPEKVQDNMHEVCGETGAAHPLVMLAAALEEAEPGDKIVMASFGQGSDALLFETTDKINSLPDRKGIKGALARRKPVEQYTKYLRFRDLLQTEMGIRAEVEQQTALTTLYRKRHMILGLVGGKCKKCGTPQYPVQRICVKPGCHAVDQMEPYEFADKKAHVKTFTGDMLAVSVEPPAIYGMVEFDEGGRFMADFTDCDLGDVRVGQPVEMCFRMKYHDDERGFSGYFWKAAPMAKA